MKITYYGHSCFVIESGGYSIALDPYADYVPGYSPLAISANEALCSHEHNDHNYRDGVKLLPAGQPSPFTVTELHSFHDPEEGALRGSNTMRIFESEGMRIAHLGDIGCHPTMKQMELLGGLDFVMVPVGGTYTLDARESMELLAELCPKIIAPMHYKLGPMGFEVLDELSVFTSQYKDTGIDARVAGKSFELLKDTAPGLVIFEY